MRSYIIFSGTGPILVLTTFPSLTDRRILKKLEHKGISKFIAHEVPLERVRALYGVPFEVISADLANTEDYRVLDFNGHHIFNSFSFAEFGEAITCGDEDP